MSPDTLCTVTLPSRVESMRTSPDTDLPSTSRPTERASTSPETVVNAQVAADASRGCTSPLTRLDGRVALDLAAHDQVAGGGLRLERLHAAAELHVGGGGGEDRVAAVRDARVHASAGRRCPKLKSPIEIVIPKGFLPLSSTTSRRPSWRTSVSSRIFSLPSTRDRRLVAVDRLDLDLADRDLDLELGRLRRVEAMLRHLRSRGSSWGGGSTSRCARATRRARGRRSPPPARPSRGAVSGRLTVSGASGTPDGSS